jgi:hypothetical protein
MNQSCRLWQARGSKDARMEVVAADGTPHVLADVGWLSESGARSLCARVEEAVARTHAT